MDVETKKDTTDGNKIVSGLKTASGDVLDPAAAPAEAKPDEKVESAAVIASTTPKLSKSRESNEKDLNERAEKLFPTIKKLIESDDERPKWFKFIEGHAQFSGVESRIWGQDFYNTFINESKLKESFLYVRALQLYLRDNLKSSAESAFEGKTHQKYNKIDGYLGAYTMTALALHIAEKAGNQFPSDLSKKVKLKAGADNTDYQAAVDSLAAVVATEAVAAESEAVGELPDYYTQLLYPEPGEEGAFNKPIRRFIKDYLALKNAGKLDRVLTLDEMRKVVYLIRKLEQEKQQTLMLGDAQVWNKIFDKLPGQTIISGKMNLKEIKEILEQENLEAAKEAYNNLDWEQGWRWKFWDKPKPIDNMEATLTSAKKTGKFDEYADKMAAYWFARALDITPSNGKYDFSKLAKEVGIDEPSPTSFVDLYLPAQIFAEKVMEKLDVKDAYSRSKKAKDALLSPQKSPAPSGSSTNNVASVPIE